MIDALNMEGLAAVNADQMREEFPLVDPRAHRERTARFRADLAKLVPKRILGLPDYEPPTEPHLIAPARLPGTL